MGPKHPVSLKLKKYNIWNSTLYKFKTCETSGGIVEQKNIIKSINHYFQYVIISKPLLRFENTGCSLIGTKLKIKIFYFIKPNINIYQKGTDFIKKGAPQPPWNFSQIIKFENLLKKFYGHSVELQLIKLNDPTQNAKILAQLIAMNLKSHGLSKIWKILLRKIKLKHNIKTTFDTNIIDAQNYYSINWISILNQGIFCKEFYSHITGLKLKLSGRISKRRGASRTSTMSRSIGTFQFNSINSFIDYGHVEKKDKNGSQSIKVYIASNINFHDITPIYHI